MSCPDDSQIRAYALGSPLDSRDRWVMGHVSGCPRCAAKLLQVSVAGSAPSPKAPAPRLDPYAELATLPGGPPPAEARPRVSLPKGTAVGRYLVQSEVGFGGMGSVYAAVDPMLNRTVALKVMHTLSPDDERSGARLLREAQAMARLAHPNVVVVHDVGRHLGHVFVAMELIEGLNLKQWLLERRSWREVVTVMLEAGKGLQAAHEKGLLHRDFKPVNVFVGNDGRVRVGDFGIATSLADAGLEGLSSSETPTLQLGLLATPLTVTGSMVGTWGYAAPEVMLGSGADARADQFSFAVSLWEALYGQRPYAGRTVAEVRTAVLKGPPPQPELEVPHWVYKVVKKGLQVSPLLRYGSMTELLAALEPPKGFFRSLFRR